MPRAPDFERPREPFLLDQLLVQHHLLDDDSDLRREHQQHVEIVFGIRVELIAFEIENADDFVIRDDRRDHLGTRRMARVDVDGILAYIGRDLRLAANSNTADKTLAEFEVKIAKLVDVVTANGFRLETP